MAHNASNVITSNCNYTSFYDILDPVVAKNVSITNVISACARGNGTNAICDLAWGSGNPDLSGIGVFVSYRLQIGLVWFMFLFMLQSIVWPLRRSIMAPSQELVMALAVTSLVFPMSIMIAASLRASHATIFELSFLQSLAKMQFFSLLGTSVSATSFLVVLPAAKIPLLVKIRKQIHGMFTGHAGLMRLLELNRPSWPTCERRDGGLPFYGTSTNYTDLHLIWLYTGFGWCGYLSVSAPMTQAQDDLQSVREIFSICPQYAAIAVEADKVFSMPGWAAVIIILVLATGILLISYTLRSLLFDTLTFAGFAGAASYGLYEMERKRRLLQSAATENFRDNEWGIGQILAIFAWLPCCVAILVFTIRDVIFHKHPSKVKVYNHKSDHEFDTRRLHRRASV